MKFYNINVMKRKLYFLLFLIFASIAAVISGVMYYASRRQEVHVFFEVYATNPAVQQQIFFAAMPENTKKIVAWHRFPERSKTIDFQKYNALEINIPAKEGQYGKNVAQFQEKILKIAEENPRFDFVFHSNLFHSVRVLLPLLQRLPKDRIKQLVLYEDGPCSVAMTLVRNETAFHFHEEDLTDLKKLLAGEEGKWKPQYDFALARFYPVVYRLGCEDLLKKEFFSLIRQSGRYIQFADLKKDAARLTAKQKQIFWRLAGFDEKKWHLVLGGKKVALFAGGFLLKKTDRREDLFRAALFMKEQLAKDDEEILFVYKPHPSYGAKGDNDFAKERLSDWVFLPAQLPFEVLLTADLEPDFVAGYSSSVFYSVSPEKVMFMIERNVKDIYKKTLLLRGMNPDKFVTVDAVGRQFDYTFVHPHWTDQMVITDATHIQRLSNQDKAVFSKDGPAMTLHWEKWKTTETFVCDEKKICTFKN